MKTPKKTPADSAEIRRRAERELSRRPPPPPPPETVAGAARQLHELAVHQIELEMQNEELKQTRAELEALLEKYTGLYDFAPVGYLTLDDKGVVQEANLTAASLLGIVRSALVNRRFGFFVSPEDRARFSEFLHRVFKSGVKEECEVKLILEGKPGFDVRLRAVVSGSGQVCQVAMGDITHQKQGEADRLILNKLESTGILAGGIAHDFNNLLAVMLLNLELAQMIGSPEPELKERLEAAKQACLMARGLTAQFVTFAKGGVLVRRLTFLSEVIQEAVRPALSGSAVRCEYSLAEDLWPGEVDEVQIGQVFHNVILNAREAMPAGGQVSVRAENVVLEANQLSSLPAGEYVRVSIADQGSGIAKDVLPKIFDPYFSTKQRGDRKGMGLGLTICHKVVQKHQGAITVESVVGSGTTFHVYLPAVRKLAGGEHPAAPTSVTPPARVLLMDDKDEMRKVFGRILAELGHEVELATDGQMAVEVFKAAKRAGKPFDVVILDLTVRGGMGGQTAIQTLLEVDPAVKAIAMSGYSSDPAIVEFERHGFSGALTKPFAVQKLQELLATVVSQPPVSPAKR